MRDSLIKSEVNEHLVEAVKQMVLSNGDFVDIKHKGNDMFQIAVTDEGKSKYFEVRVRTIL